ncbi:MAG: protein kinase domain-containing protein, partial [Planctomycetota bacterium]
MPYQRLKPGDRTGEYILEEKIGEGEETEVWRGTHHVLHSPAAVKVAYTERGTSVLQRAGVAQHTLRHPRVVQVLGLNLENDPPFLVTTFIEGESLRSLLERESPLKWERFEGILRDMLEGLDAIHGEGKAHGNLKPSNVLVDTEGRAYLTDFGEEGDPGGGDSLLSGVLGGEERGTTVIDA